MNVVKEKAFAKINLYLDVTGKRTDGFHDIETVMHTVTLCDSLTVSFAPSPGISVTAQVKGAPFIPKDERNLAVLAAKRFLEYCGISGSVRIVLDKHIPVCAGLGGGSSDAAAVLRALNRIHKYPLSDKILMKIAAEIGSDVPYCVRGKTALGSGKGDDLSLIPFFGSFVCLIAIAKERIRTPEAYASLDEKYCNFDGSVPFGHSEILDSIIKNLKAGNTPTSVYNVFETAVFPVCKGAAAIKNTMLSCGAVSSALSGSGPAVFGLFTETETADACKAKLEELGYSAYLCYSVL